MEQIAHAAHDAADVFGPSSRIVGFYSLPLAALLIEAGDVQAALRHSDVAVPIIGQHSDPASRLSERLQTRTSPDRADIVRDLARLQSPIVQLGPDAEALRRR